MDPLVTTVFCQQIQQVESLDGPILSINALQQTAGSLLETFDSTRVLCWTPTISIHDHHW